MPVEPQANSRCAKCGAEFHCGVTAGEETCWCMALPVLENAMPDAASCYCPRCLKELQSSSAAA